MFKKNLIVTLVAVQYIGREEPFIERNYRSNLTFMPEQTRNVPAELAGRLLRHADVFKPAEATAEQPDANSNLDDQGDDTAKQLALAEAEKADAEKKLMQLQDLILQVNVMDKDALKDYAQTKYGQALPKTLSVENMRAKVAGMIEQFGPV